MRKTIVKRILTAALSAAMLASAASAAPLLAVPAEDGQEATAPAYTIRDRALSPIQVWGTVKEKTESQIYLENSNESDPYNKIYVNVSDETMIVDAATGEPRTFDDVKEKESVYAYVGPAMGRSMPPVASATLLIVGADDDHAVPTYLEVQSVTVDEDGRVSALTDRDVIIHLTDETPISAYKTKNIVGLEDIKPGAKVLAWYSMVAMSMPAQATPTKVMVFPYGYETYLTATEESITLDGDMVIPAKVENEKLLVPVRTVAEALGCEVTWVAEGNKVAVTKGGEALYEFPIGGENVTFQGSEMALTVPAHAVEGVTYIAVDDVLVLHNVKLAK